MLDTWYHPPPMIRVFTQSPDMIADMIWMYGSISSPRVIYDDMVDEVLFTKKRRFSLTKTIFAINYSPLLLFAHHSTSTKIGDDMKTLNRGFQKERFPDRLVSTPLCRLYRV